MRTGAQLLVDTLLANNAEIGFGVPGESYLAVLDALYDAGNAFRFINARHEGGAAFMAEAYGKLTGRPGICFVTRGPGATNASIGIHTAMQDSVPMIVFVGQIETGMRDREAFQELDYRAVFGPMAKWVTEIDSADRVPELVSRAFSTAMSGRPGPVVLALPEDMLIAQSDAVARGAAPTVQAHPSQADTDCIMSMLAMAERPVVIAGGSSWSPDGKAALQRFLEANKLPLIVTFRGQDTIANESPSYVGDASFGMDPNIRAFLGESDLLLVLNARFGETLTAGYELFDPADFSQTLIHVHAAEAEIGKVFTPDLGIIAGPNEAARALEGTAPIENPSWAERTEAARASWLSGFDIPDQPGALDLGVVLTRLRETLPDDAIVTNGAGNFAIWANRFLMYGGERRLLGPQAGSMGAGVPAAVMAKLVHPDRTVICFAGDGDFQMTGMELGVAQQYGAAPIVLVINNGQYGTIRMHQEREFPGRVSGTQLVNPDFTKIAEAFGLIGERVERTEDFEGAFERALASRTGALIELVVDPEGLAPRATVSGLRERAS